VITGERSPAFAPDGWALASAGIRKLPHDLRPSAVCNLPRSVAMKMVGHKTRAIYQRYAIVSETDLSDAAIKLAALQAGDAAKAAESNVVPLKATMEK